jgi:glutamate N-acetyltransferase/amino-acid N-acetyltransferase
MATLLAGVFTDAKISKPLLDQALKHACERSFNSISVDGDTSTNDTWVILANGASGTEITSELYPGFVDELTIFGTELAKLVVRDGEGATKHIKIHVKNAASYESGIN